LRCGKETSEKVGKKRKGENKENNKGILKKLSRKTKSVTNLNSQMSKIKHKIKNWIYKTNGLIIQVH
jgi:uncharacterized membrane protein (DUF106 family)